GDCCRAGSAVHGQRGRLESGVRLLGWGALQCSVLILISAGEASGEMYGAQLIQALRRAALVETAANGHPAGDRPAITDPRQPPAGLRSAGQPMAAVPTQTSATQALTFLGVGWEWMRAAGCDTVVDCNDMAGLAICDVHQ